MKIFHTFPILSFVACSFAAEVAATPYQFDIKPRSSITEDFYNKALDFVEEAFLAKRDDTSTQTIESILISVNNSGIIWKLVDGLANSPSSLDNIASLADSLLSGNTSSISALGLNVTLNTTSLLNSLLNSGLLTSFGQGLLLDDTGRDKISNFLANSLVNNPWISKLLQSLGEGKKPTVPFLANLIQNTTSKDPNQQTKQIVLSREITESFEKRANSTDGSAQAFINNIVSSVLQSNLVSSSVDNILVALNNTGVAVDIVLQALDRTDTLYKVVAGVVPKLYASGVFNSIDTNGLFQMAKKKGYLTTVMHAALTDPTYSPAIAKLFQYLDNKGVFVQVKLILYGP